MTTIEFVGEVLPRAPEAMINTPPVVITPIDPSERRITYRCEVISSVIWVFVDCPNFVATSDLAALLRRATDVGKTAVNIVAFASGVSVQVVFNKVIFPNGNVKNIVIADSSLRDHVTVWTDNTTDGFYKLFTVILGDNILYRLLSDLIETQQNPHVAAVNCGAIVDGIRRVMTTEENGPKAWQFMHDSLNISRGFQEEVSRLSTGPRHRAPDYYLAGSVASSAIHRTWQIMDRFFVYKLNGNRPLDKLCYPELIA